MVLKLKQTGDARWSKTLSAWHAPYTKEAFRQLKELFPAMEYETTAVKKKNEIKEIDRFSQMRHNETKVVVLKETKKLTANENNGYKPVLPKTVKLTNKLNPEVEITVTHQHFYVKLPKNEANTQ